LSLALLSSNMFGKRQPIPQDDNESTSSPSKEQTVNDVQTSMTIKALMFLANPSSLFSGLPNMEGKSVEERARILSNQIQKWIAGGNWSLRMLCLGGGIGMIISGFMSCLKGALTLSLLSAFNELCIILFGAIVILIESPGDMCSYKAKEFVHNYLKFLSFLWGRAIFYFYIGLSMFSTGTDFIMGLYMFLVGLLYLAVAFATSGKLDDLKNALGDKERIKEKYIEFAGTNQLMDDKEFCMFCAHFGISLNHNELEAAILNIDVDHDGYIELSELQAWMDSNVSMGQTEDLIPSQVDQFHEKKFTFAEVHN